LWPDWQSQEFSKTTHFEVSHLYERLESFTKCYRDTYYSVPPTLDEIAINRFIGTQLRRLGRRWKSYIEISPEGSVHHMIPFVPWVEGLISADFREDARLETRRWMSDAPEAFSWDHYISMALAHENIEPTEAAVRARRDEMRSKLQAVVSCDVTERPIVDSAAVEVSSESLLGMFFVAGEVGETVEGWQSVMRNVCDSLPVGGHVFMSALRGMTQYEVRQPDGTVATFPCASLYGEHYDRILPTLGFSTATVEEFEIPVPDCGLSGIIMVSATKTAEPCC